VPTLNGREVTRQNRERSSIAVTAVGSLGNCQAVDLMAESDVRAFIVVPASALEYSTRRRGAQPLSSRRPRR
jgi:hypothetical protein